MGIMGYGGAEFQPLYVGDFAKCVARLFDAARIRFRSGRLWNHGT